MHPDLYSKIIRLKEKLASFWAEMDSAAQKHDPEEEGVWKRWQGQEQRISVAGADGSFNHLKRLGFYIMGATGAGFYSSDPSAGDVFLGELDMVRTGDMDEDALRAVAQSGSKIMEAKALVRGLGEMGEGIGLVDGSLRGLYKNYTEDMGENRIARLAGVAPESEEAERLFRWARDLEPDVAERFASEDWASWSLWDEIRAREGDRRFGVGILMALVRHEYLLCLRGLILPEPGRIWGISKTSGECSIAEGIPDIYLLTRRTRLPGFTEPAAVDLPQDEDLPGLPCSYFYARLEEGRMVMRVELFAEPGEVDPDRVLSQLLHTSVNGYPYPLAKAHNLAVLSFASLNRFLGLAGGEMEPTGREGLAL